MLLTKRNFPIVDNQVQKRILNTKLGFIGCGLGSNIAVLATRVGFRDFKLADGDIVEHSNLNRQEFSLGDVGKRKTSVLQKRIRSINSTAKVQSFPYFLNKTRDITSFIKDRDIIVNTADFGNGFFEINRIAAKMSVNSVVPFNVGFGTVVTVFNKKNVKVIDEVAQNYINDGDTFVKLMHLTSKYYKLPKYFTPVFQKVFGKNNKLPYVPQIGVASELSAALVVSVFIKTIKRTAVPLFPRVSSLDLLS